jgi:hypothetical protein
MEQEGADLILSIVVPEIGPTLMVIVVERAISWMRPKVRPGLTRGIHVTSKKASELSEH